MLHDGVVAVGVNPDVAGVGKAELEHGAEDAPRRACRSDTVDDEVGQGVVGPLPLVDVLVGGFRRWDESEGAYRTVFLPDDIADPSAYVVAERVGRWISVGPLMEVPALTHGGAGVGCEGKQVRDVALGGFRDGVGHDYGVSTAKLMSFCDFFVVLA